MASDKNDTGNSVSNSEKNEQERVSALLRAIHAEMETMAPEDLERLYAVVALMVKKADE